jgi:hypothetical protein
VISISLGVNNRNPLRRKISKRDTMGTIEAPVESRDSNVLSHCSVPIFTLSHKKYVIISFYSFCGRIRTHGGLANHTFLNSLAIVSQNAGFQCSPFEESRGRVTRVLKLSYTLDRLEFHSLKAYPFTRSLYLIELLALFDRFADQKRK